MSLKVIVFDLWATLVRGSDHTLIDKVAQKLGMKDAKEFWDYADKHYFPTKLTVEEYVLKLTKERNLDEKNVEEMKKLWIDSWSTIELFSDSISTLKKLKKKYSLGLLSNTGYEEAEDTLDKFKLRKYFDHIILSSEVGLAKPDPRIFELVAKRFHVKPEEVLFIGDHLTNDIIPAKFIGFQTVLLDRRGKYTEYEDEDWYITSLNELKL